MTNPLTLSTSFRIIIVSLAITFCFLTAGVIFGYPSLKPVLISSGIFNYLCKDNSNGCDEQILRLDFMFTIAASATNVSSIFIGIILDSLGPRITSLFGSFLFLFGGLGFGISHLLDIDLYIISYTLLAIGGPFIFMSTLHLSLAFPSKSGLIMSLLTGAFDASSIIYFFLLKLYEIRMANVSLFFLSYSIVPICTIFFSLIMMPRSSFAHDSLDMMAFNANHQALSVVGTTGNPLKDLRYKTARKQIFSTVFILLVLFMCLFMIRINFYIATIDDQLRRLFHDDSSPDTINLLIKLFGIMLPLGGIISIPPTAYLLDKAGIHVTFIVLYVMVIVFGIFSMIANFHIQIIALVIFVTMRPLLYTAANEFCARTFGFETFGKVYGLVFLLSGLFNLLQSVLNSLTKTVFHGDFVPVNTGLTILTLAIGSMLPIYTLYMTYRPDDIRILDDTENNSGDDGEDIGGGGGGGGGDDDKIEVDERRPLLRDSTKKPNKLKRMNRKRKPQLSNGADLAMDLAEKQIMNRPS